MKSLLGLLKKSCHSCVSRNLVRLNALDSRFRGNDSHFYQFFNSLLLGFFIIFTFIFAPCSSFGMTAEAKAMVSHLEARPPKDFVRPKITRHLLSSGIRCYFLENHELPLVEAEVLIKTGRIFEPKDKVGLGSVLASLLRSGGTLTKMPDEVDEQLDQLAIDIGFSISDRMAVGSLNTLAENTDEGFRLFFEMLFKPRFDEGRFKLSKKRAIEAIKRRNETTDQIAARLFNELIYGKDSPWGRSSTIGSIERVQKEDLIDFHNKYYAPNQMILAIAGDFNTPRLIKLLEELTRDIPRKEPELTEPAVPYTFQSMVAFAGKKSKQAAISIGHLGTSRYNPDKFALLVMDDILGGMSFKSILKNKIRSELGLAYEVWSDFGFGSDSAAGVFEVHAKTMNEKAATTIELILKEIGNLAEKGEITSNEVKFAKESIINRLVFEYATPFNIISNVARFVYWGYPEDYVEVYKRKIGLVKREDVLRVAREYLHPDGLKVLVVGEGAELLKGLKKFGVVKRLKYD